MKLQRFALFDASEFDADASGTPPESFLLIRYGRNAFTKAGEKGEFEFNENDANTVIAEFNARGRDLVIDFEHQSLSGEKAPAAGWIDCLEKTAEGISAKVKYWTDEAARYLKNGEYRYFSPTLYFSRSGKTVSAVHSVALTNHPAMHHVPALAADDLSEAVAEGSAVETFAEVSESDYQHNNQEDTMKKILEMLKLQPLSDASETLREDAVCNAVASLVSARESLDRFLESNRFSDLDEAADKLAHMVPEEEYEQLRSAVAGRDAADAVAIAFSEGKLTEASRKWALSFAERDPEAFKEWCKDAPKVVPDNRDTDEAELPDTDEDGETRFTEKELEIFKLLGLDRKKLKKQKKGTENV